MNEIPKYVVCIKSHKSIEVDKIYEVSDWTKVNDEYYYNISMSAWYSTKLFISL